MPGLIRRLVDADTHVSENEHMWEHIDREMYHRRPVLISVPENTLYGDRNAFWLIDGNIFPKPAGKGGFALITPSAAKKQQTRTDISAGRSPIPRRAYATWTVRGSMFRSSIQRYFLFTSLMMWRWKSRYAALTIAGWPRRARKEKIA